MSSDVDRVRWRLGVAERLGMLRCEPTPGVECDPSWGPLGSLAKRSMTLEAYARLLERHITMLALKRAETGKTMPQPTAAEPPRRQPAPQPPPDVWAR